ncbi:MAG: Gfo/Idh/MocA family oxidoreductase [Meiothermus sp.]|nr:Gfo/Idh/MocA family oxidoreductase [Meiothermus sp.]
MRVGLVGSGVMGEVHAAGWRTTAAELVGVYSQNAAQAERLAEEQGVKRFDGLEALLKAVDIVDICVPTYAHKAAVLAAARAGKHILCEKPIALSVKDGEEMIAACNAAGVRLFIAMVLRFFPQYRLSRQLIEKGQIGSLGVMRLKRVSAPPNWAEGGDNWYTDEARSGGMVVDLMIHDFDYARWLAGGVERVFARLNRAEEGHGQYAQVILRHKSGPMALIEGGWAYPKGMFRTSLDISGTDGLIEWSSDSAGPLQTFTLSRDGNGAGVNIPVAGLSEDPYALEIQHAYGAIVGNQPFEVTAEDGLEALRIALAAKQSIATGKAVSL